MIKIFTAKSKMTAGSKKFFSCDYDVTIGGVAHKAGTYTELKLYVFSKISPKLKKSSTIRCLKSSF